MDSKIIKNISDYAKLFVQRKYIESGYIAVRESDGIAITVSKADLNNIGENDVVFVNDKNIESFEGNFRAAAVILFCAIRQDKMSEAAAIVDSDSILKYSSKRKPLQPVMDNVAKLMGVTVKCASKNVAAEIVTALSGYRNACFMPDAGALIKARSLKELLEAVNVLDKACNAEILAENKGGTRHINPVNALIEQIAYKFTTRLEYSNKTENEEADKSEEKVGEEIQNTESTDVEKSDNTENVVADGGEQTVTETSENPEANEDKEQGGETESADEASSEDECDICLRADRRVALADGKIAALACPKYVTAVCAIGKPMTVTSEYVEKLGEEINCLPSKMILTDKAFEKALEMTGDSKVCFMAQHGVIIKADGEQDLTDTLALVEDACKEYFNTQN